MSIFNCCFPQRTAYVPEQPISDEVLKETDPLIPFDDEGDDQGDKPVVQARTYQQFRQDPPKTPPPHTVNYQGGEDLSPLRPATPPGNINDYKGEGPVTPPQINKAKLFTTPPGHIDNYEGTGDVSP